MSMTGNTPRNSTARRPETVDATPADRTGLSRMSSLVTYAFYPLMLTATVGLFAASMAWRLDLARVFMYLAAARFVLLITVERLYPARHAWRMTWPSFKRDLKYMLVNAGTAGLLKLGIGWLALDLSRLNTGVVTGMPMVVEFLALVLVFEFFQYGYHRFSHEGPGRLGAWLWKVHLPHHLPDKVYLLMHPVGHPLNFALSLALVQLPLVVLGARQETIFLFNALMGLQGLVSHFNVDIKAGPLNYLLVGTELHRFHHSADRLEAKNYGVLTPVWDIVFGTFSYHPTKLPNALGVEQPEQYPPSAEVLKVLALPFKSKPVRQGSLPLGLGPSCSDSSTRP
jgi:sterol desaturase/sphingolipid hydroxylase (fatty acid hydroxylase superfamily)